jgi:transposase-like protein
LHGFIKRNVSDDAEALYTDNHSAYDGVADENTRHEVVNHSVDEWVRGDVHTNTVESAWSLFKRGVAGSFHKVSKKHLDRYLDEFEFRFNNRNNPFIFRDALKELLTAENIEYKELIA